MEVLFCRPVSAQHIADTIDLEVLALEELGITFAQIAIEPIVNGEPERALERIDEQPGRRWLYRGWMLDQDEYGSLEEALSDRGEQLVVSADEMAAAAYVPSWYEALAEHTADTRWTEGTDTDEAWERARELQRPWIVKDHVKSAKELWHKACFVPADALREDFVGVCAALLDARGDRFERGFVIRSVLPLAELPYRMPDRAVHDEHRLFVWEGEIVAHAPYHDVDTVPPPLDAFDYLASIDSPFFTADVARLRDGSWKVIELNDGGMSTLPELMDPRELYRGVFR